MKHQSREESLVASQEWPPSWSGGQGDVRMDLAYCTELGVIMDRKESEQRLKNNLPPISNGSREDLMEPEGPEGF